ncbi:porin family protein [Ferruginibacter sp. SUN106]|uniref:porin family protein n=1 Tax=Ferruginibacter sp. SUN106 TaxID=2978348 RepID=UPI003D35B6BD
MQNREFEKKVQEQMEKLKFTPADAVWDKVEASLPEEKKRRRWIVFIVMFGLLISGSLFLWKSSSTNDASVGTADDHSVNQTAVTTKKNDLQNPAFKNEKSNTTINIIDSNPGNGKNKILLKTATTTVSSGAINKKVSASSFSKIKIRKGNVATSNAVLEEGIVAKNQVSLKTKAAVKIKTKTPQPIAENEEIVVVSEEKIINNIIDTTTVNAEFLKTDSVTVTNKKTATDTIVVVKKDTALIVKKEPTKKNEKKWEYGIDVTAGSSAVKNSLFNNTLAYSNTYSSSVSSSPGTGISTGPNKPSTGLAFSTGFYAARMIADRWQFKTGLSYSYQSNTLKVGSKVDSTATFNFDMNKSIAASSYFRPGNSVSYMNNFHLLEIPLLFQYQWSKRSPFNFEMGPTVSYLINSNALVYSNSSGVYFTGKDIFNKLLVSVNAGAGFTFAKQPKWPITFGYRFKYGISSVIKNSLSKQHFVNSMLYLKIPFKK